MGRVSIVVADDHPVTRDGTVSILQRDINLCVVGEVSDGMQAVEACRTLRPDLLLLDARLPKMEGLMVLHLLDSHAQATRVIMFSAFADEVLVRAALDAGARGYVLKNVAAADLLEAIRRVMRGQLALVGVGRPQSRSYTSLSAQELVTLNHVAQGLTTREIALVMCSSTRTVETYLNRIFLKLGANNRTQAVMIALREQLLLPEENKFNPAS